HYRGQWLFKDLHLTIEPGKGLAVTGPNGSGKSTLLLCLAELVSPDLGHLLWSEAPKGRPALAAPGMELPGEFTLQELLDFHFALNPILAGCDPIQELEASGLRASASLQIRHYSSGMTQKLRLVLALLSDSSLLLLDEPHSHLDAHGQTWFQSLLSRVSKDRCLVIASNDPAEYSHCGNTLALQGPGG
ncbi:MAG: ATP-binding cassette domain-containing protein, partial [Bacteroidetes bacterium]|nr:ATP-binding cassette domain-containing protein [Bacteroidota bacterium]